jgi:hypothetical protein
MEEWRNIDEHYQVSSLGNVKSLERVCKTSRGNGVKPVKERLLKQIKSGYYLSVTLNGKSKRIHQLVATAFLNHIPDGFETVVDHIDGNKLNNNVNNLRIVSHRENTNGSSFRKGKENYSSQYIGVSWNKKSNKWNSQITIKNKKIHLGMFTDEIDASNAYQNKLKEINSIYE